MSQVGIFQKICKIHRKPQKASYNHELCMRAYLLKILNTKAVPILETNAPFESKALAPTKIFVTFFMK